LFGLRVDIAGGDLQTSADVLLRLHAEWRWYRRELRMLYLADSKLELPLQKWAAGERLAAAGGQPRWVARATAKTKLDGADFREYLEAVLASSDGPALLAESVPLAPEALEPGAFLLRQGHPAEVVVVLDVASSPAGKRAMMLAHARNPAENIHVIRPSRDNVWYPVRTDQPVRVLRAQPFSWKDLRRIKRLWSPPEVACIGSLCPKTTPASGRPAR
jgi:hypothetical protein